MNKKGFTISELLLVFAIVLVLGVLMLPFIKYSQTKMERTFCANNLRQVGLALYIYAREHAGKFPENIQALYDEQYLSDKHLMDCPASQETGTVESPDYIYAGGLSVRDLSSKHLLEDKKGNHDGGENILYVNADIKWKKK